MAETFSNFLKGKIEGIKNYYETTSYGGRECRFRIAISVPILAVNDKVYLHDIPIDSTISGLNIAYTALGAGNLQLGLYSPVNALSDYTSPTVVNATTFASTIAVTGASGFVNYRYNTLAPSTVADPLWKLAGNTNRPSNLAYPTYIVGLNASVATTATGTISIDFTYATLDF